MILEHQIIATEPRSDKRKYFRKACYLPITSSESGTKPFGSILNLSASGLFIETKHLKAPGERINARFCIRQVLALIEFSGEVIRVDSSVDSNGVHLPFRMGLRFISMNTDHQKNIKNYVLNNHFNDILKDFQKKSNSVARNIKPSSDVKRICTVFTSAVSVKTPALIFWCNQFIMIKAVLEDINHESMSLRVSEGNQFQGFKEYTSLCIKLIHQGVDYFFEATVKQAHKDSLIITFPHVFYFEERRMEGRDLISEERGRAFIKFTLSDENTKQMVESVRDINSAGLSFNLPLSYTNISPGEIVRNIHFTNHGRTLKQDIAKVAHVTPIGKNLVKIGLEFQIERQPYEFRQVTLHDHQRKRSLLNLFSNTLMGALYSLTPFLKNQPQAKTVRYLNKKGEEIVGLLDTTFALNVQKKNPSIPVVIIPPAFARRKETTSLLALTIIENFKRLGKDIAVLRFDGIRTIGESHNDEECRDKDREMLNFKLTQAIDDLLISLDFVHSDKSPITPSEIIVVSFSNASVAARKAILSSKEYKITYWISAMGITDPQDLILNATCGIDYISNYVSGDREGTFELLGHLVKKEILGDVINNQMAYLADTRRDMSIIETPVTWIYGKHDYWTNQNRIKDVMSVKSRGRRLVIEVPTGHIVRTGSEAMRVFGLITENIWEHLQGQTIEANPPKQFKAFMKSNAEWSRVKRHSIEFRKYWQEYLIGKEKSGLGFDVLSLTEEYTEMMEKQINLLKLSHGDILCDMGGGTGNLTAFILKRINQGELPNVKKVTPPFLKIIQTDLISEILRKSKTKHKKLREVNRVKEDSLIVAYIEVDLDIKRVDGYLPFLDNSLKKVIGSLLISYLAEPEKVIGEFYRILKPGGILVLSSLKRDTDFSETFHRLVLKIKQDEIVVEGFSKEEILSSVQEYINSTAYLSDLEEEGTFKFYSHEELKSLLLQAGFSRIEVQETGGNPPKILVAVGHKNNYDIRT